MELSGISRGRVLMALKYLPKVWEKGTDFLGTRYAILCGAMTWVSESNLVSAISNAGGVGVIAGGGCEQVRASGARVLCFAPVLSLARRLIRQGVDALIIEGNEAGGHIGPVATSLLAQEVLLNISEVPIFVAGGIGTGEMIAQYLSLGASGAQLGTRFVVAEECIAHPRFKEAFIRAHARDAMPTMQLHPALPTLPVRAIVNEGPQDFT